ncbi:MAG: glycosyltransferase family 39 protein [Candidatus Eisenbacteria bacterium]|nr:glycosyltransferase family 39 protein [Candidatus Eisenbacteria bacterium]
MTPRRWLLLALALGALLRFFGLGREGLWVDEAYTSGLIHGSAAEIWARLRVDDAPPLFYLLSKGFVALAGPGEFALRLLPALASIGVIAVVGLLLERQSTRTLLVGLGLAATSALLIYYGRQARSYSLLQFEASLLLLFTLRAGERLDARRAIVVALLGLSALYTHNLGLWPFTAAVLALLPKLRGAERKPLLLLLLLGALGAIPWAVRLAEQVGIHRDLNQWMAKYWETRPYALAPLMSLGVFVNGGNHRVLAPDLSGRLGRGRNLAGRAPLGRLRRRPRPRRTPRLRARARARGRGSAPRGADRAPLHPGSDRRPPALEPGQRAGVRAGAHRDRGAAGVPDPPRPRLRADATPAARPHGPAPLGHARRGCTLAQLDRERGAEQGERSRRRRRSRRASRAPRCRRFLEPGPPFARVVRAAPGVARAGPVVRRLPCDRRSESGGRLPDSPGVARRLAGSRTRAPS